MSISIDPMGVAGRGDARMNAPIGRLRALSGQIAGRVFFGSLLAQMRGSSLKGKYGHGGRGEDVFGAQLDGLLAERVGRANRVGLGEVLFNRLAPQQLRIMRAEGASEGAKS